MTDQLVDPIDVAAAFNRDCHCITVDRDSLDAELAADLEDGDLAAALRRTHRDLFAAFPVFVSTAHLGAMRRVVAAVEAATRTPGFRDAVAARVERSEPERTSAPLLGFDFHLPDGDPTTVPQLIEINTNPGGVLLALYAARAQRACCAEVEEMRSGAPRGAEVETALVAMVREAARDCHGDSLSVAIVDEDPPSQFLFPELRLYRRLFARSGMEAAIADPSALHERGDRLALDGRPLDVVYNRLTDFELRQPPTAALRDAWRSGRVGLTPDPWDHALYADKRNFTALGDAERLHLAHRAAALRASREASFARSCRRRSGRSRSLAAPARCTMASERSTSSRDALAVGLDAVDAARTANRRRAREDLDRLQQVVGDHRHHHVELEVARHAGPGDRGVVADHLRRDHQHRLGDHRVDLAGHDRAARLQRREGDLADAAARARASQRTSLAILVSADRDRLQRARGLDRGVLGGQRLEAVGRGHEGVAGARREPRDHRVGEARRRVEPGADRGAAERELGQARLDRLEPRQAVADLLRPARDLLAEAHRHRVLQVGAADLDHVVELARLGLERRRRARRGRARRSSAIGAVGGDVDGRRDDVVRRLAER
jgi:hypothetical protein